MREQFTFYRSFWDAAKTLNKKDRQQFLEAVILFALDETEIDIQGAPLGMFSIVKPVLESAAKKSKAGKTKIKTESNGIQTGIKTKSKPKQEKEQVKEQMLLGKKPSVPTVEEVRAYCRAEGLTIDPEKFVAYYDAVDWMRGNTRITDWKALARTWRSEEKGHSTSREDYVPAPPAENWLAYDPDWEAKLPGGS